jgi:hypothetical protein
LIEGRKGFEGRRWRDEVFLRYPPIGVNGESREDQALVNRREERIQREEEEYG